MKKKSSQLTKDILKGIILDKMNEKGSVSGHDIGTLLSGAIRSCDVNMSFFQALDVVQEMIERKELVQISYAQPGKSYRNLFLPGGTRVIVIGEEK